MSDKKGSKKGQTKGNIKIKTCKDGKICSQLTSTDDVPTKVSSLGCRLILTLISCGLIGYNIQDSRSFFSTVFMFSLPLAMDYLRFQPQTPGRKVIKWFGLRIAVIQLIIAIFGFVGIFEITNTGNQALFVISQKFIIYKGSTFDVKYVWAFCVLNVFTTALDWTVYKRKIESQLNIGGSVIAQ